VKVGGLDEGFVLRRWNFRFPGETFAKGFAI
jgi:hypothetical protein